jgi:hypothetical protein
MGKKKPKHLKPTYLSNYLDNMKPKKKKQFEDVIIHKKIDQIMALFDIHKVVFIKPFKIIKIVNYHLVG